ncbi:transcriptional protein SWT1 [Leptidea sinapis]|uniref:transcriptional protein SWT1 n=1 Tax=Leptidea sinapis TaxID=189913 RepID=UPI00213A5026|nr:transcriptional protein SWT1 [Leptidea sinapis]
MNTPTSSDEKLPDGWVLCASKSTPGRNYYFNRKTGKSSWTPPQESNEMEEKSNTKEKHKMMMDGINKQLKSLKRKSDSQENCSLQKKQKQSDFDIQKRHSLSDERELHKLHTPTNTETTSRCSVPDTSKKLKKNLANARLSQLRAQLNDEAEAEETSNTNNHNQQFVNSKPPQPNQKPGEEVKTKQHLNTSPNKYQRRNPSVSPSKIDESPPSDSKSNHSQFSETLHSIPSPSQFFAANKIISSMKAQLPEEFCNKQTSKDTFADIEKEICSQTTDYPFSKHPATPPQFSEASKLVSAIKSKLAYRVSTPKDVKTFSSPKERMEELRTRLSKDVDSDSSIHYNCRKTNLSKDFNNESCAIEAMDVEDYRPVKLSAPLTNIQNQKGVVLVFDTNIFIHDLDLIRTVLDSHLKGYSEQPTLLVPWRVINELDRLKDNNSGKGAVCKRARAAMDYLYKSLPENNRIKGQSLRDANSHIYPCETPDDEILNCSLQQVERGMNVLLVSSDKNLCSKAAINGVHHIGVAELRSSLRSKPQPASAQLLARLQRYRDALYPLLANILENEMRAKYNHLWRNVIFKEPPWSLEDVLQCLLKHWIAVFSEVFPRIEQLINDLKHTLVSIQSKDPKTVTHSEVMSFKELCLDVAQKCRIIPEYMEMAKQCVGRISSESETASPDRSNSASGADLKNTGDNKRIETTAKDNGSKRAKLAKRLDEHASSHKNEETHSDMQIVVEAFEFIWTVYSSYCAKIASAMGVEHSIEDSLHSNDELDALTDRLTTFSSNIDAVANAINKVLSSKDCQSLDESVTDLEARFREALTYIGVETGIHKQPLRVFCEHQRHMLQEAYGKFVQLSDLLVVCKNRVSN